MNQNKRLFKDLSRTKTDFKDLYGKFHNADILKIYYLNEETCPSQLSRKAHSIEPELFLHFGCKLAKHNYPSTQAAYKTDLMISDNQTFMYPFVKINL